MTKPTSYAVEMLPKLESAHGFVVRLGTKEEINIEEVYISNIRKGAVSAWKLHKSMHSRLTVVSGLVRFVFPELGGEGQVNLVELSSSVPSQLTINPMTWFGFMGLDEHNSILNLASEVHVPNEVVRRDQDAFVYDWSSA